MDTTTVITATDTFKTGLNKLPPSSFAVGADGIMQVRPLLQSGRSIVFGTDTSTKIDPVDVPSLDTWCINAPLKDPGIALMIQSYISRCNRMRIYPAGTSNNFEGITGQQAMDNAKEDLVGNLVIKSISMA